MSHEELLNYYVDARLRLIGHTSGNMDRDARELRATARTHAYVHGLTLDESAFDIYIYEEEDVNSL